MFLLWLNHSIYFTVRSTYILCLNSKQKIVKPNSIEVFKGRRYPTIWQLNPSYKLDHGFSPFFQMFSKTSQKEKMADIQIAT